MDKMVCTSECNGCINGQLIDSNTERAKIYCKLKEKQFYYGQRIPCEDMKKKREDEQ